MYVQLFRTFASLFTTAGGRLLLGGMIVLLASMPVAEMLVIRQMAHLISRGPKALEANPSEVYTQAVIYFAAFLATRAVHHWGRYSRTTAVRRAFAASGEERTPARAAWEWALGLELTIALMAIIQVVGLSILIAVMSVIVGVANALIALLVLAVISWLYQANFAKQTAYTLSGRPTSEQVGDRVRQRLRDAEYGAASASLAMAIAMAVMLFAALKGKVSAADAIVMVLAMRLLYGQLQQLSASAMRFGRAQAKRTAATPNDDPDDEYGEDVGDDDEAAVAKDAAQRAQLLNGIVAAGQRGDRERLRSLAGQLGGLDEPGNDEKSTTQAAEAFADYLGGSEHSVGLHWRIRPFPGVAANWLNPLILQQFAGRGVRYAAPGSDGPHLVMAGALGSVLTSESIAIGTGANADDQLDPSATYVSLRGPLSAARVDGVRVERFGDPLALTGRIVPVRRRATNGRTAFVPHHDLKVDVQLGEAMDQVALWGSRPDGIRTLLAHLLGYDSVVTTSPAVMTVCASLAIPCGAVTFSELTASQRLSYEDFALGLGLPVRQPTQVGADLAAITVDDLLADVTIGADVLDDISDALADAVALAEERQASAP